MKEQKQIFMAKKGLANPVRSFANLPTVYYFDLLGYGQSDKSEGDVSLGVQSTK
jgi:hypothetical protein